MVANCSQRVGCGKSSANIAINNFSHSRCLWCSHNKRWSLFPLPWIWNSLVTCLAQWSIAEVLWLFSSGFKQIGNWHSLWELWTPTQEVQLFCWRDMRRRVEVVVSSVHSVWVPGWKQPGDYSSWPLHEPRSIQRSMKNLKRKLFFLIQKLWYSFVLICSKLLQIERLKHIFSFSVPWVRSQVMTLLSPLQRISQGYN